MGALLIVVLAAKENCTVIHQREVDGRVVYLSDDQIVWARRISKIGCASSAQGSILSRTTIKVLEEFQPASRLSDEHPELSAGHGLGNFPGRLEDLLEGGSQHSGTALKRDAEQQCMLPQRIQA